MNRRAIAVAATLTLVLLGVVLSTQLPVAVNNGAGWDGSAYARMTLQPDVEVELPFALRIGYPWLGRTLGFSDDLIFNFKVLSVTLGVVYAVTSYLLLSSLFPGASTLALTFGWSLMNLSELSPLRMAAWYPIYTDIPVNLLLLALLGVVLRPSMGPTVRDAALALIFFSGTLIRENFTFNILLVACMYSLSLGGGIRVVLGPASLRAVVASTTGALMAAAVIWAQTGFWIVSAKGDTMIESLTFFKFVSVLQALLAVYGVVVLLMAGSVGLTPAWLKRSRQLLVFFLLTIPVALAGGGNIERFLFWYTAIAVILAMPYVIAITEQKRWLELGVAGLYYAVLHRFFVPIHTTARVPLDSGCGIEQYARGGTPHLMHHVQICSPESLLPFLLLFCVAAFVVLVPRIRVQVSGL